MAALRVPFSSASIVSCHAIGITSYTLYVLYHSAIARSASFRIEESGKSASASGGLTVAEEITPFFSRSILAGTGLDAAKGASVAFFQTGMKCSTFPVIDCSTLSDVSSGQTFEATETRPSQPATEK